MIDLFWPLLSQIVHLVSKGSTCLMVRHLRMAVGRRRAVVVVAALS